MSGMENPEFIAELGYDDGYVSTPDSRRAYHNLLNIDWAPAKFVGLRGKAIAISAPHAHLPHVANAVEETTRCIRRAMGTLSGVLKPQIPKLPPKLPPPHGTNPLWVDAKTYWMNKKAGDDKI